MVEPTLRLKSYLKSLTLLVVYSLSVLDDFCRTANRNGIRWDITIHDGACSYNRASANSDAIEDQRTGSNPDVIFNDNSLWNPFLFYDRRVQIMVFITRCNEVCIWPNGHIGANFNEAFGREIAIWTCRDKISKFNVGIGTAQNTITAYKNICPDFNIRVIWMPFCIKDAIIIDNNITSY